MVILSYTGCVTISHSLSKWPFGNISQRYWAQKRPLYYVGVCICELKKNKLQSFAKKVSRSCYFSLYLSVSLACGLNPTNFFFVWISFRTISDQL